MAAKQFVAWASSQDYEETVAEELGWQHVPAGKRTSTYENADYQKAAAPFYKKRPRRPSTPPIRRIPVCSRARRWECSS